MPEPLTPNRLVDRQEIADLCVTYTLALDSRDWDLLRTVFIRDAVADYGSGEPSSGYHAIEATCRRALEPLSASQHLLGNHMVRFVGGGAASTCYFQATHVDDRCSDGQIYTVGGRYDDRVVATSSGWRIAQRTLRVSWVSGNPEVLSR